ncbi:MAG: ParB/RepB/Spo0J family partition protein [Deltaproteobacteria bacterium]|nr:ParB/RepB/Spo0J family partition protein [Deltaproteobacteria bacterium]
MQERRALGKGLSSLIPIGNRSDSGSKNYFECPLEDIIPNQNQPRKLFDKTSLDELAASIEEKGILQPLIVRRMGGGKYELIAGERRFRAAQQVHLEKVPVVVKEVESHEVLELALIENLQREDLNPIEEALAYKELISLYQYTQDELAKRLGKDRSTIANMLRLLRLPEGVRAHIISGALSMGHARAILAVDNRELQEKISEEVIKNQLSVREIENWMRRIKDQPEEAKPVLKAAPTPADNPFRNVEDDLRRHLKTRVQVRSRGQGGKLIIHFHSNEDLNRIFEAILK